MISRQHCPISLSWTACDLPLHSDLETHATLYPKDRDRFHLFLRYPPIAIPDSEDPRDRPLSAEGGLLWFEMSPHRVVMTMQGRNYHGYRHFWERGVYGKSRYWSQDEGGQHGCSALCLRNFTRSLLFHTAALPQYLQLEYELWSDKLPLGRYQLELDIHHPWGQ